MATEAPTTPAVKFYALMRRRPDLTADQFSHHWRHTHSELAKRIRRIRRYSQAHALAGAPPGIRRADYDGVAEVWFDDLPAALGLGDDPDYLEGAALDDPNFIDVENVGLLFTRERFLHAGGSGWHAGEGVKMLEFVRRAPSLSPEEFAEQWVQSLADAAKQLGLVRHAVATALPEASAHPAAAGWDAGPYGLPREQVFTGVHELWWSDEQSYEAAASDPVPWRSLRPPDVVDVGASSALLVDEVPIPGPDPRYGAGLVDAARATAPPPAG